MDTASFPQLSSRFEIQEMIGEGGMGRIYKAWDRSLGRFVAIKTVRAPDPADRRRIESEVRLLSKLRHEGVVRLVDSGLHGDEIYLALELCEGAPMERLVRETPLGAERIRWLIAVAVKIAEALEHIHACGVIHRDLKPANIMLVAPDGSAPPLEAASPGVKLIDFGLALESERGGRESQTAAGTPLYMAPEQIRGAAQERSDLYSLGVILYHLIAGEPPFDSLAAILSRPQPPPGPSRANGNCPPGLSDLILALIDPDPHARPATAGDVRARLLSLLHPSRQTLVEEPRLLAAEFIGREHELAFLRRLLGEAAAGRGGVALIAGPRGAGKSWLVRQSGIANEALADHGMRAVRAGFTSRPAAGEGLEEALSQAVWSLPAGAHANAAEAWREWRAAAAAGEPIAGQVRDEDAAAVERARGIDSAVRVLRHAASSPALLIFESIEHAGEIEIEVLSRLARGIKDLPALLCLTHRPGTATSEPLSRWLAELAGMPWMRRLDVAGLGDSAIVELLRRRLYPPGPSSTGLVAWLQSRSAGLPGEIDRRLRLAWSQGRICRGGGLWLLDAAGTRSQEDAAADPGALIRGLAQPERRLLLAAALWESPIGADFVACVAPGGDAGSREDPLALLQRLAAQGLMVEVDGGFAAAPELETGSIHAAALADLMGAAEVRGLHERLAEAWIEASAGGGTEASLRIARHLDQAGRTAEAARWYRTAAAKLKAGASNALALEALERAQELGGPSSDLDEEIADLATQKGDYRAALRRLHSAAGAAGRPHRLLDKIGRVHHRQGDMAKALEVFSECLAVAGGDPRQRALSLLRLGGIHLEQGAADRATPLLEESLALYTRMGDLGERARVQFSLGVAAKQQNRAGDAILRMQEALANAERAGSLVHVAATLNNLGNLHRQEGDHVQALACLKRSLEFRDRLGDRQGVAIVLNNISRVYLFRGELHSSREATEQALRAFAEIGDRKGVVIAACNIGETLVQLGQIDPARRALHDALASASDLQAQRLVGAASVTLGALELDAGEPAAAAEHLHRAVRSLAAERPTELRAQALSFLSAAAMALNDAELAGDSLREAREIVEELALGGRLGAFHRQEMRFHLERGDPETALELGKPFLKAPGGLDRLSWALLRLEAGRTYRELGPDWADRTERELGAAIEILDALPSPINAGIARLEMAQYWQLVGESPRARQLVERAEFDLRACGALKRIPNTSWSRP